MKQSQAAAVLLILILVGWGIGLALAAEPQVPIGTVTGKVVDAAGNPAADCVVTLQQNAQKMREAIQGTTDKEGKFTLENVPEGKYNLNIRSRDAKAKAVKSLTVNADQTTDIGTLKLKSR